MMRQLLCLLLGLLLAGSVLAQSEEVYRWVDEEGNVHYGDQPPEEGESQRVRIRPGPDELQELEAEEDNGDERDAGGPRLSEAECEGMQERLEDYRAADTLYRINEEGEEEELEPEVAQAEMDRMQTQIEQYCQ